MCERGSIIGVLNPALLEEGGAAEPGGLQTANANAKGMRRQEFFCSFFLRKTEQLNELAAGRIDPMVVLDTSRHSLVSVVVGLDRWNPFQGPRVSSIPCLRTTPSCPGPIIHFLVFCAARRHRLGC